MNIVYVRPLTLFGPLPNIHAQLLRTLFHDKLIYTFSLIASQMCTGTIFYNYYYITIFSVACCIVVFYVNLVYNIVLFLCILACTNIITYEQIVLYIYCIEYPATNCRGTPLT